MRLSRDNIQKYRLVLIQHKLNNDIRLIDITTYKIINLYKNNLKNKYNNALKNNRECILYNIFNNFYFDNFIIKYLNEDIYEVNYFDAIKIKNDICNRLNLPIYIYENESINEVNKMLDIKKIENENILFYKSI